MTNQTTSSELTENVNRIHSIAAQLAGFKPTIAGLFDAVDKDTGDTLALLGGMAEYLNNDLATIADKLDRLGRGIEE